MDEDGVSHYFQNGCEILMDGRIVLKKSNLHTVFLSFVKGIQRRGQLHYTRELEAKSMGQLLSLTTTRGVSTFPTSRSQHVETPLVVVRLTYLYTAQKSYAHLSLLEN